MNHNDDNEIKNFFQQLKEDDLRVTPSFLKSLEIASSKIEKGFRHSSFFKVAATSALLILVGIAGFFLWHEQTTKPLRKHQSISQWRPPTEFLLKTPGQELLKTVPKLGQSLEQRNRRK